MTCIVLNIFLHPAGERDHYAVRGKRLIGLDDESRVQAYIIIMMCGWWSGEV